MVVSGIWDHHLGTDSGRHGLGVQVFFLATKEGLLSLNCAGREIPESKKREPELSSKPLDPREGEPR